MGALLTSEYRIIMARIKQIQVDIAESVAEDDSIMYTPSPTTEYESDEIPTHSNSEDVHSGG